MVVEYPKRRDGDDGEEDGKGLGPYSPGRFYGGKGTVGSSSHEGAGIGSWCGDEGAMAVWRVMGYRISGERGDSVQCGRTKEKGTWIRH